MSIHLFLRKFTETAARLRPAAPDSSVRGLSLIALVLLGALLLAACAGSGADQADTAAAVAAATATPEPEPTDTPAPEPALTVTAEPQEEADRKGEEDPAVSQTFAIAAEESEIRFNIEKVILGKSQIVVGTTKALSGALTVNPTNPSASVIDPIQIEASTFVTDDRRRNTAIRRFILQSNRYQFITFNTTALSGMPDTVAVGDEFPFEIAGNLTIRDITKPMIFAATLQVVSESEVRGSATTVIALDNFEIAMPELPKTVSVGDEIIVEFDFVARAE